MRGKRESLLSYPEAARQLARRLNLTRGPLLPEWPLPFLSSLRYQKVEPSLMDGRDKTTPWSVS